MKWDDHCQWFYGQRGTNRRAVVLEKGTSGQAIKEDAASVSGYTGTLSANSEGWSGQAREEAAASVCAYSGTL